MQLLDRPSDSRVYANVLLEEPVVSVWNDHFVLRRYSPLETLGGGRVLEPQAPRLRARELPDEIALSGALDREGTENAVAAFVEWRGRSGIRVQSLASFLGISPAALLSECENPASVRIVQVGDYLLLDSRVKELRAALQKRLEALHEKSPESGGFARAELKVNSLADLPDVVFDHVLQSLIAQGAVLQEGPLLRKPERRITLTPAQEQMNALVLAELQAGAFAPPSSTTIAENLHRPRAEIERSLVLLEKLGKSRRLGLDLFFDATAFDRAEDAVRAALQDSPELSVADASRILGSSRKYVVPFLEYLDNKGITQRVGNVRIAGRAIA